MMLELLLEMASIIVIAAPLHDVDTSVGSPLCGLEGDVADACGDWSGLRGLL